MHHSRQRGCRRWRRTLYNITDKTEFYPFNNCFIESMELPSDFINTSMQSDADVYFADVDDTHSDYRLKELHQARRGR